MMHTSLPLWSAREEPFRAIAGHVNEIIHQVNTNAALLGADSLTLTRLAGGGAVIGTTAAPAGPRMTVVKITAVETGGGKYAGHLIIANSCASAADNLALPEAMIDTGNNNALVLNLAENGLGDVHTLALNSFHSALGVGYTAESPPRAIALIYAIGSPVFAVTVTQTGGYNGTSASPASWTYRVQTADATVTLGVNIELTRPRPNGSMAPGNAFGLAFYQANGNLQLWDAGEIPD